MNPVPTSSNPDSESNPYCAPSIEVVEQPSKRTRILHRVVVWVLFFSPLLWWLSHYVTFGVAWLELGRKPVVSLDDPLEIGTATVVAWRVSAILLLVTMPAVPVILIAIVTGFLPPAEGNYWLPRSRTMLIGLFLLQVALAIAIARVDPGDVFDWWID